MKVTDADRAASEWISKILDIDLEPWQEEVLARIMASHRLSGTDNTPCTSVILPVSTGGYLLCTERGPHRVHRNGDTTWIRTCGVVSLFEPGMVCGREPHPFGTPHSSGAYSWL